MTKTGSRPRSKPAMTAQAKRNALVTQRQAKADQLAALRIRQSDVAGSQTTASGEFAAVQFAAASFGVSEGTVARIIIYMISSLPNFVRHGFAHGSGSSVGPEAD